MRKTMTPNVSWVGKIDWELKRFHGDEYSTHRGSSYNSYLVTGDDKTVLIDTVWGPFAKEFVDNLEEEGILEKLDAIIVNHAESDHSGALPELLARRPGLPLYCTANGVKVMSGHYHADWDFRVVKTGDKLDLGGRSLTFVEAPMLHWPDSMFCYLDSDQILFSNDAFGQHYASENLYNDLVDQAELYQEAIKYYANILTPFSAMVAKKIDEVVGLNLPVAMIATSHGIIWRKDPLQIVTQYQKWAADYQEDLVTIIYDTMWDGTRRLAEEIAAGIKTASPATEIVLHNSSSRDKNDIATDVFRAKAIVVGSPTINRGILHSIAGLLEQIRGLGFKNKKAAAFGSFGWSGESPAMISEALAKGGFAVYEENLKQRWHGSSEDLAQAREYGAKLAKFFG